MTALAATQNVSFYDGAKEALHVKKGVVHTSV